VSTLQYANMTAVEAERFMANAPKQPVRRRLAEIVGERKVVDIGCGKAEEVDFYMPDQYLGVDCSLELLRIAHVHHPLYNFEHRSALSLSGHWPFGIIKSVLEHLPSAEAIAVYNHARTITGVLLVVWHMEPRTDSTLHTYDGELDTPMQQNRHSKAGFMGMIRREVCAQHVIWTVV